MISTQDGVYHINHKDLGTEHKKTKSSHDIYMWITVRQCVLYLDFLKCISKM